MATKLSKERIEELNKIDEMYSKGDIDKVEYYKRRRTIFDIANREKMERVRSFRGKKKNRSE